jgi:hypothetical protein
MENEIDFVLPWVDGNDPKWQKEKEKYDVKSSADGSIYRYRDWDLLRYWFRGVEKYAPWAHKIHFVTMGHLPEWLDTSNPKLNIVNHKDFIPEKYLPTFSSRTIDCNTYRIKDLTEQFVLFCDDFYIINNTKKEDFFENGMPKDTVALNVHCPKKSNIGHFSTLNDVAIINEHFDFKKSIKENKSKWFSLKNGFKNIMQTIVLLKCPRFPGFWQHHLASPFLKSTLEEVWKEEPEVLDTTCMHKFRDRMDINQWLFREWQIAKGNFSVRSHKFGKSFFIDRDGIKTELPKMVDYIQNQKGRMIAINDGPMEDNEFENAVKSLKESFEKILPEKSSFEK